MAHPDADVRVEVDSILFCGDLRELRDGQDVHGCECLERERMFEK